MRDDLKDEGVSTCALREDEEWEYQIKSGLADWLIKFKEFSQASGSS